MKTCWIVCFWFQLGLGTTRAVSFQIVDRVEFKRIIDTNAVQVTNATINARLESPT